MKSRIHTFTHWQPKHGSLIDRELLNNILNNPEVIEKLVRDYGAQNNAQYVQNMGSSSGVYSYAPNRVNQVETTTTSSNAFLSTSSYTHATGGQMAPTISTQWHPRPVMRSAIAATSVEAPSTKDVNYYKSLIQQHGGDKQEALPYSSNRQNQQPLSNYDTVNNFRAKGSKAKIMKPCIFFNSSRGCRNGANCAFQHDASFQPQQGNPVSGVQSSKRMKMDNEISS